MAANSAFDKAPNKVITPATTQTLNNKIGEPNCEAIRAGFIKIPEPITPPTTIAIVDCNDKLRLNEAIGSISLKIKISGARNNIQAEKSDSHSTPGHKRFFTIFDI